MAGFEDGRCYACGKRYLSRVGTFLPESRCAECGGPICLICWNGKRRHCREHEAPVAAPAPAAGVTPAVAPPPGAVTRAAAGEAELAFLARLERNLLAQPSYHHPGEGRSYAPDERAAQRADLGGEEVRRMLRTGTVNHPAQVFAEMPLDRALVFPVSARALLGRTTTHVLVAGCALHPLAEHLDPGWSSRPMEYRDAARVIERWATDPAVFHYFAFFSPTGWSEDARRLLTGAGNVLVALVERHGQDWVRLRSADERWRHAPLLFELHTEAERAERVAAFVRAHTCDLLLGGITDRCVADALGLDPAAVRLAFEAVCRADPFVRGEIDGDGTRLVRVY